MPLSRVRISTKHSWRRLRPGTPEGLPAAPIREIYGTHVKHFFDDAAVKAFLAAVVFRECPVRRNGLSRVLACFAPAIMTSIFNDLRMRGLWPQFVPPPESTQARLGAAAMKFIETAANLFKDRAGCRKGFGCAVLGGGSSI